MIRSLAARLTGPLIVGTVVVAGFGFGTTLDRAVVGAPAWQQLGAAAWAAYSRHADLGNGLIVYPVYGAGVLVLAISAAVSYRLDRRRPRSTAIPIYLAAAFAVAVMVITAGAAPIMVGVPDLHGDGAVKRAFEQFTFWGLYVRGVASAGVFLSSVWALSVYPRPRSMTRAETAG